MEEAELSRAEQLACEALMAEKVLEDIGVTASSQYFEEVSPKIYAGGFSGSRDPQPYSYSSTGYTISGLSCAEHAYEVEFDELISYYRKLAGKHGFKCRIGKPLQKSLDLDYGTVATYSTTQPSFFYNYPGIVLYLPPTPPYITDLPSGLRIFSQQHGLQRYIDTAIILIGKCFQSLITASLKLERDPESDEEWLAFDLTIQGSVDSILSAYNKYTERWISMVPYPQRDKIRLAFDIR
jgi:hypothetical protein